MRPAAIVGIDGPLERRQANYPRVPRVGLQQPIWALTYVNLPAIIRQDSLASATFTCRAGNGNQPCFSACVENLAYPRFRLPLLVPGACLDALNGFSKRSDGRLELGEPLGRNRDPALGAAHGAVPPTGDGERREGHGIARGAAAVALPAEPSRVRPTGLRESWPRLLRASARHEGHASVRPRISGKPSFAAIAMMPAARSSWNETRPAFIVHRSREELAHIGGGPCIAGLNGELILGPLSSSLRGSPVSELAATALLPFPVLFAVFSGARLCPVVPSSRTAPTAVKPLRR